MSIGNKIGTATENFADSRRTFANAANDFSMVVGHFRTIPGLTIPIASLNDQDYWNTLLEAGQIFPFHYAKNFKPEDEPAIYADAANDKTIFLRAGKYKGKMDYDFNLDYHINIQDYNGQELPVIFYDENRNVLCAKEDSTNVKGFTPNLLNFEKMPFATNSTAALTTMFYELRNSDEWNVNGYKEEVDFDLICIDRQFMQITLTSSATQINIEAKYRNVAVTSISQSNVTVTDDLNGELTFDFTNSGGGVYILDNFSSSLTSGCVSIEADLYLGRRKYRVQIIVIVTTNRIWEDDNNAVWENGENRIFEN